MFFFHMYSALFGTRRCEEVAGWLSARVPPAEPGREPDFILLIPAATPVTGVAPRSPPITFASCETSAPLCMYFHPTRDDEIIKINGREGNLREARPSRFARVPSLLFRASRSPPEAGGDRFLLYFSSQRRARASANDRSLAARPKSTAPRGCVRARRRLIGEGGRATTTTKIHSSRKRLTVVLEIWPKEPRLQLHQKRAVES